MTTTRFGQMLVDRVASARIETAARHPRNNPDWPKVGILAQRAKNRLNQMSELMQGYWQLG